MQYYKSENDDIKNTTEEWKSNFNGPSPLVF